MEDARALPPDPAQRVQGRARSPGTCAPAATRARSASRSATRARTSAPPRWSRTFWLVANGARARPDDPRGADRQHARLRRAQRRRRLRGRDDRAGRAPVVGEPLARQLDPPRAPCPASPGSRSRNGRLLQRSSAAASKSSASRPAPHASRKRPRASSSPAAVRYEANSPTSNSGCPIAALSRSSSVTPVVAHQHLVVVEAAVDRRRRRLDVGEPGDQPLGEVAGVGADRRGRLGRRPQVARLELHRRARAGRSRMACSRAIASRDRLHPRRALALAQRRAGHLLVDRQARPVLEHPRRARDRRPARGRRPAASRTRPGSGTPRGARACSGRARRRTSGSAGRRTSSGQRCTTPSSGRARRAASRRPSPTAAPCASA